MKLTFDIIFQSDYHIGAGYGLPPEVDSALHRDSDGVPVIRGTVLAGLLRQGLYDLLQLPPLQHLRRCKASGKEDGPEYCGQWGEAGEPCPICAILGAPAHPKPWQISSARPVDALAPLKSGAHWQPGDTAAQITTRARINPRTRRAEHNKLFSREEGDGRLRFRFEAHTAGDDARALDQAAWLTAAARMVRRLGAGRRRGLGACEIQVQGDGAWTQEQLLKRFAALVQAQNRTEPDTTTPAPVALTLPADPWAAPYRVGVVMRLDEPLLVARRAEAGNRFESVSLLPGTLLRGALAWRIAQRFGAPWSAQAYETFLDLFFRDGVRFSFLYPLTPAAKAPRRAYLNLPAPRDLRTCEIEPGYKASGGHKVWSKWDASYPSPETCPTCGASSGGYRPRLETLSGFILMNETEPKVNQTPAQSVEMHIRMDAKGGRVQSGALFSYVALEPGQYFAGEITCADKATWQALLAMAGLTPNEVATLRLGKAIRRGHGKVSVAWRPQNPPTWLGKAPIAQRVNGLANVSMTFLSDAIITDDWGRPVSGFDAAWIARELDLEPTQVAIVQDAAFARVRPVASFDNQWGLPRWEDRALAAGSTVLLHFKDIKLDALQEKLAAAEGQGLGWRREEGFGRVAFNHPLHHAPDAWDFERVDLKALMLAGGGGSAKALADFRRRWQGELDAQLRPGIFRHETFAAVARIMQATPGRRGRTLTEELQKVGKQENVVPNALEGRENTSFAESEDGRAGMAKIFSLLEALKRHIDEAAAQGADSVQLWKMGLEMLAERMAKQASNAKK